MNTYRLTIFDNGHCLDDPHDDSSVKPHQTVELSNPELTTNVTFLTPPARTAKPWQLDLPTTPTQSIHQRRTPSPSDPQNPL